MPVKTAEKGMQTEPSLSYINNKKYFFNYVQRNRTEDNYCKEAIIDPVSRDVLKGCTGFFPVSLQFRPYIVVNACNTM